MVEWIVGGLVILGFIGVMYLIIRAMDSDSTEDTEWVSGNSCPCGFRALSGVFHCCPSCGSTVINNFTPMRRRNGKIELRSEVKDEKLSESS